jgi:hypothetical protein
MVDTAKLFLSDEQTSAAAENVRLTVAELPAHAKTSLAIDESNGNSDE